MQVVFFTFKVKSILSLSHGDSSPKEDRKYANAVARVSLLGVVC